jgi:regulatory protein
MHRITGLVAHPRTPGRFTVAVDGARRSVVSLETVSRLSLAEGRELSHEELAELDDAAAETSLEDRALRLLAARAYGTRELRRRLLRPAGWGKAGNPPSGKSAARSRAARRGAADTRAAEADAGGTAAADTVAPPTPTAANPAAVDAILARLEAQGLLDDAAFARQFARSRALCAGASRRFVLAALATRGIDRRVAESAVDEVFADEGADDVTLAARAAQKRLRVLRSLAPDVRRRRLQGYLARRGFGGDAIRKALASLDDDDDSGGQVSDDDGGQVVY